MSYPHIKMDKCFDGEGEIPVITGTKIPVHRLYSWYNQGLTVNQIVRRYPQLGIAKVLTALAFAHDNKLLMVMATLDEQQAARRAGKTLNIETIETEVITRE